MGAIKGLRSDFYILISTITLEKNMTKLIKTMIVTIMLCFIAPSLFAGEGKVPTKTKGVEMAILERFVLKNQIPAMKGFQLLARRIVVAPGGGIAVHNHSKVPGFMYLLAGSITEYRGDIARKLVPGDTLTEESDTVHGTVNTTNEPAVLLAIHLVPEKK